MFVYWEIVAAILIMLMKIHDGHFANCPWPPIFIHGRRPLNRSELSYSELGRTHNFMVDGEFKPFNCTAKHKVAIIIPYRNREPQLKILLNNVIPRLYRQQIEFGIYVIEQPMGLLFNKGALINIGFMEAQKRKNYDCYIIHDVDIIPEDDRNYYICGKSPRHLAHKVEQNDYRPYYAGYIGGTLALTSEQINKTNGFSNLYAGWGMEDDDFYRRILSSGYILEKPDADVAFCGSLKHTKASRNNDRCNIFVKYGRMWQHDGLNSIKYKILKSETKKTFTKIIVDFNTDILREAVKRKMEQTHPSDLPERRYIDQDGYCMLFIKHKLFLQLQNNHNKHIVYKKVTFVKV